MILLRKGKSADNNIFVLHDGIGEVITMQDLAMRINPKYNIFGIQYKNKGSLQNDDIKSLANEYVKEILEFQKDGEFTIMGWSLGGTLAYEVVCCLELQGYKVKLLVLIDAFLSRVYCTKVNELKYKLSKGCLEKEKYNEEIINLLKAIEIENSKTKIKDLNKQDDKVNKLINLFEEIYAYNMPSYKNMSVLEALNKILIMSNFQKLLDNYRAEQKINVDSLFFIATNNQHWNSRKGWKKVLNGKTEFYKLDAKHNEIIYGDNAGFIADRINLKLS